ncbi:MAG: hypothetical protein JSV44_05405 [Candidatus Zixiibacteriota bacterium]|nr:MAG: hypothetical protein JSV44_05405 [candidate division Zixibacteria bacterium]
MGSEIIRGDQIAAFLESLKDNAVELIDFDKLAGFLSHMQTLCGEHERVVLEMTELKNEYRGRIVGMLKAILACRHDPEDAELAAMLTDGRAELPASRLISMYKKVAARFRSHFPASFKYLAYELPQKSEKWQEHKI